jgi:hypothetical protein
MRSRLFPYVLICVFITGEGCVDESIAPEVQFLDLTIRVFYDTSYSKPFADSARVIVRNNQETTVDTLFTDTSGTVVFRRLIPGTFDISVRKILFPEQMFVLTGVAIFKPLNAALNGIRITAQPDSVITFRFPR